MLLDHGPSRTVDFVDHFFDQAGDVVMEKYSTPSNGVAMETNTTQESSVIVPVPRSRVVTSPF